AITGGSMDDRQARVAAFLEPADQPSTINEAPSLSRHPQLDAIVDSRTIERHAHNRVPPSNCTLVLHAFPGLDQSRARPAYPADRSRTPRICAICGHSRSGRGHMTDEAKVGGLSAQGLGQLRAAISEDISRGLYRGATVLVARNGQIGLHESLGQHRSDDPRPIEKSSVFSLFSLTKGFTNVLVFRAIERGQLALT